MDRSLKIVGHPREENKLSESEKALAIAAERQSIAKELVGMQLEVYARAGITRFPLDRLQALWSPSDEEALIDWLLKEDIGIRRAFWGEALVILPG